MRTLLDIVNESKEMPKRIRVQAPWSEPATDSQKFKQVYVDTIPEIAWAHIYPLSLQDEMSWQRRITGEDKLCYEEGNYIYFLSAEGSNWNLVGIYDTKEENLYMDSRLKDFENCMGSRFSVTMHEKEF